MNPSIVAKKPKPGTVVGVPLGNGRMGAIIYLTPTHSSFGDAYGFMRGVWSADQIRASDWNPPVFRSPLFTSNKMLHDAKWLALAYRPDLTDRFDPPEYLHHPEDAPLGMSHGKFGLAENSRGEIRELSEEEARSRFLLLHGHSNQGPLPSDIIELLREHCLTEKERAVATASTSAKVPPVAPKRKPKTKSLAALKRERFFSSWKGFVPADAIRKAEAAVHEAIESLEGKSPAQAARRLATLVRTFNNLDFEKGSIERETIMDAVEVLASACGVDEEGFEEVIDAERDF
jgi:hypothetical protein